MNDKDTIGKGRTAVVRKGSDLVGETYYSVADLFRQMIMITASREWL